MLHCPMFDPRVFMVQGMVHRLRAAPRLNNAVPGINQLLIVSFDLRWAEVKVVHDAGQIISQQAWSLSWP